jgi:phosphatidylserine/phosphatidylglycerophosphate/cardiolipin synthase-like enzyme
LNFHIGSTPLRPEKFGPETLESLAESVAESAVRKSKKATAEALDSWSKSGTISSDEFATLSDYTAASRERYNELKSEWWKMFKADEAGKPILEVEAKMAREGNLLARHDRLMTEMRESTARAAVQALAGAMGGPIGVVAAYSAYSNGPTWTATSDRNAAELLKTLASLEAGDSRMVSQGNDVKQVHREELWKTMNTTLDTAIANGKAGKPAELDLQYYEMTNPQIIGKIAEAAKAGNPVRLNLDAGRLSFPSKDTDGDNYFSLDATPDKIRTILQLAMIPGANVAVSLFPQKKLLNSPTELMHRKIMRYGDEVLISGMNANVGSGENVDSGYLVKGPAARQLIENFARDIKDSKGASLDDIWGAEHIAKFQDTNLRMGKRGFVSLFDSIGGPSPAGTVLPSPQTLEELEALAKKAGANLRDLVEVPADKYEKVMTKVAERRAEVVLSAKGKEMMRALIEKAIAAANEPGNLERLDQIELPSGEKVGKTRVDIADQPVEREALAMNAIAKAEKFVYLPGFVVTKAIAAAIVARRDELKAEGKDLDVRVVADSGLYPHGGTPNSMGIKHLEDNGIAARWSRLERSSWHDRKIHAKQLLTEKGEITGSTNFSNAGFQDNWETSAFVHFDESDAKALKERDQAVSQFESLWDTSYELNSHDHSKFLNRARGVAPSEWTIEEDRDRSIRHTLRLLINYEKQSGALIEKLASKSPEIATRRDALIAEGYSKGDATLMATQEHLGPKKYRQMLDSLPSSKQLTTLQQEMADWKAGKAIASDASVTETEESEEVEGAADDVEVDVEFAEAEVEAALAANVAASFPTAKTSPNFRRSDFYIGNLRENEVAYLTNFR